MATQSNSITSAEPHVPVVPRLENGDCLSRAEFERRYEAMPELKKAELIEGVVYLGSPVSLSHGDAHARVIVWLGTFAAQTPGVQPSDNATVRLDMFNEVQPDVLVRSINKDKSAAEDNKRSYLERAPELVIEIASSSVSRDLHSKLQLYRRHGVPEYIVWRINHGDVDWFRLAEGDYVRLAADENGILCSREFPGLWLDNPALLRGDMATVLAVLGRGLASPEHADFVVRTA